MKTITTNPHPQINYLIFAITLVGGVLILISIKKLMVEAKHLSHFTEAQRSGAEQEQLQAMALNCDADIAYVLRMVAASSGRSITHQEQIALENELHKAASRLNSRNALPQFLGGLLVGMGLLGTFIGLLATLDDIAILISSFGSLDMKTADPIQVFGQMVQKMEAPMHSMGIAFSASMYGLLGSIIIGFMMVSVRRCMGEIMSILGSEVAQHIEFALARDGFAYSKAGLKLGLGKRPAEPLAFKDVVGGQSFTSGAADAPGVNPTDGLRNDNVQAQGATFRSVVTGELHSEEVRVLRRIEERLTETARIQERNLNSEIDDFHKQRAEMLRALAENSEASNNFRSELQRVGRQLGSMLNIMEKGNDDINEQMREIKLRMADDSTEMQRLLATLIEVSRERS
ncbi:MAG: hypothetical protein Q8J59_08375 [Methylotenera sp.]|nr:hypothetical protein [Methylotenera sp.]MDP2281689.1 hypothetical protein [Methylotenera sp.]MDP3059987.1 hypothetical protein [Methylotenera sp.]